MALAWPSFSVCIWSLRNSCIFVVPNSRSKKKKKVHRYIPPPSCLPPLFFLCLRSNLQYLVSWGPHTTPIIHLSCLINMQTFLSHSEWYLLLAPLYGVSSVEFSRSVVSDSLRPHESQHIRPPCPSPTPRVYSNSCPSGRWCHPAILSSVVSFSCPQSFPVSGSFPMSQLFTWVDLY